MKRTIAYVRVSTERQTVNNQKDTINRAGIVPDKWVEATVSTRRTLRQRRIDEVLDLVYEGDTLVVAALDRLGRSVGQITAIVDALIKKGVDFISVRDNIKIINGEESIQSKMWRHILSMMAELERDLISERTKAALAARKAAGVKLGRPAGYDKSKLDAHTDEIKGLILLGVPKTKIAKKFNATTPTLYAWMKKRNIYATNTEA